MHKRVTEKQRHTWSALVLVAGLSTLPMSLSLLAVTAYIRFAVDEELELVQGMDTAALPYFLALTGTINFLGNLLLLGAMARAHRPSSREAAQWALLIAIIVDLVATAFVFCACIFCFVQMAMLPSSFQKGLTQAMQQYSKVPHVKVRLDILQMEYECCGDSGYQDWFQVPWVPQGIITADSKELQAHLKDGTDYLNDDVPFSCCDPASPRPCIHHHVATNHLHYRYDHHINTTLYAAGCRQALMEFFGHTLLRSLGLSLLLLVLVQLAVLVLSRLLQTSNQSAIDLGDVTATTVGYLFRPPTDKGLKKDEETGVDKEKQALLESEERPGAAKDQQQTTDTEGETTEEPSSYPTSEGEPPILNSATDTELDTLVATDEEPVYENIAPEFLYDDLGAWTPQQQEMVGELEGQPLFPSEMASATQPHNNNWNYARRRSSKAFNSLGITPRKTRGILPVTIPRRLLIFLFVTDLQPESIFFYGYEDDKDDTMKFH